MAIEIRGSEFESFGLRKEWLSQTMASEYEFFTRNTLGSVQLRAFIHFLRDCNLIDKNKKFTELFWTLKNIFNKEGIDSKALWGVIWTNLCFNSPLFRWWASVQDGYYTRDDVIDLLASSYGKMNRCIVNGYSSIFETLERSPIGEFFGQGVVRRNGRSRSVHKEKNGPSVPCILILYNLYRLAEETGEYKINIRSLENIPCSPQRIFNITSKNIESILGTCKYTMLFNILFGENDSYVMLKNSLESIEVLETYKGGAQNEIQRNHRAL